MTKFTISLIPEGDAVSVTDGEHKGRTGVVTAWKRIDADHTDPIHVVRLDTPIQVEPRVYKRADGALIEEPAHQVDSIEVPVSQLVVSA